MKKNIHIISHTHWDREWYMPFEYHRARLVELIDTCIILFEKDDDFHSFFLDGHTACIEDYLEIKPQNRDKIKKYVTEGRLVIGPWYILQDEFLTSSEANVRNLLTGMKVVSEFGGTSTMGYFPDSFGNVGQMPQILKQAGMRAIAFGRGVKPTGMNNTISDFAEYNSQFSEMYWQSPDKSKLPAILFANWYNNGAQLPTKEDRDFWERCISNVVKYASTDELLLMNGSDHMPVQTDVSQAIKIAAKMYPEYNFIHSDFERYISQMTAALPEELTTIEGELINQDTDGWWALVNTASSHIRLKQMNRKGEILLESTAEPLCAICAMLDKDYPHDMLAYSWKTLMKNHPHDSICGCSVDGVMDEMKTRFDKSRQAAETIVEENLAYLSKRIDTSAFRECDAVFSVINTYARPKGDVLRVVLDLSRHYSEGEPLHKIAERIDANPNRESYILVDEKGLEIPCRMTYLGAQFGFELPKDRFRKSYMAEQIEVFFEADNIPPLGYKTYGLLRAKPKEQGKSLITAVNIMENAYIKVRINADGTIDLTDKSSERQFKGLLRYEDTGDIGNEYTYIPVGGDIPVLSGHELADIQLICDEEYAATYKITTIMQIPKSADELHKKEQNNCVHFTARKAKRSREYLSFSIDTYVTLEKNALGVKVRTEFTNTAKDHRLRVLIPTGLNCETHRVESVFEAVERNNRHKPCWTYPSGCEHQQGFVMMQDAAVGIMVANIGLYEYEITEDHSIALTLLRAVGEMGDWGYFPTRLSQCQGEIFAEYEIFPFTDENKAFQHGAAYQYPLQSVQHFESQNDLYKNGILIWSGEALRLTAFKNAQDKDDLILRWVNYSQSEEILTLKVTDSIQNLYRSNIIEEKGAELLPEDGQWKIPVKPFEILTLWIERPYIGNDKP